MSSKYDQPEEATSVWDRPVEDEWDEGEPDEEEIETDDDGERDPLSLKGAA